MSEKIPNWDQIAADLMKLAFESNYKNADTPRWILCSEKTFFMLNYRKWLSKKPHTKFPRKLKKSLLGIRSKRRPLRK